MKIFVVSLKRSTDRRRNISRQMAQHGIDFEFIDAVDCKTLTPHEKKNLYDKKLAKLKVRELLDGEICCAISHQIAYEKIITENIPHAIIMEDDAIIPDSRFKSILNAKTLEKSDQDMILLYSYEYYINPFAKDNTVFKDCVLYKPVFTPISTTAYYINRNATKKLYNNHDKISYVADFPYPIRKLNLRVFHPAIIQHPPIEKNSLIKNKNILYENRTSIKNILYRFHIIILRFFINDAWDYAGYIGLKKLFKKVKS